VSASDIPETHADPMAMARCLASYLSDPDVIFRRVKAEFGTSPCHETIRDLRAHHLRPPTPIDDYLPCDQHKPNDERAALDCANRLFLRRLQWEREAARRIAA